MLILSLVTVLSLIPNNNISYKPYYVAIAKSKLFTPVSMTSGVSLSIAFSPFSGSGTFGASAVSGGLEASCAAIPVLQPISSFTGNTSMTVANSSGSTINVVALQERVKASGFIKITGAGAAGYAGSSISFDHVSASDSVSGQADNSYDISDGETTFVTTSIDLDMPLENGHAILIITGSLRGDAWIGD